MVDILTVYKFKSYTRPNNGYRLMVDRSSSKRCVPIRIRLAVKG